MDAIQIKKLLPMLMTALIWDINFRLTFKNMNGHMDLGCYPSLKFDPLVVLIKNISSSVIFLLMHYISKKFSTSEKGPDKLLVVKTIGSSISYHFEKEKDLFLGSLVKYHNLYNKKKQIFFCIKIFLVILFIYICEEIYFVVANMHILDRLNVPMRNLSVLVTIFIFSSLLITKQFKFYKHQLIPSVIVIGTSLFIILFNAFSVARFRKIFNINFLYYMIIYVLMGIEIVLIKYLTDILFINPFLILTIKGIFGSIIFLFINIYFNGDKLFYLIDKIMAFEYENMYEDFIIVQKIFYIITTIIVQYLKVYIINENTESHFLSVAMISDVFFFPLYFIEKFGIQKFPITTSSTFYLNIIFGVMNSILLLIFNEVIEIKFCGIEKDLNKNIEKRENMEMDQVYDIYKDDDNDSELDYDHSEKSSISSAEY
jgi:hypothetical protein